MNTGRALVLAAVLGVSLALNLWNNGFPLGYHIDEPVKVRFIKTGTQDFKHPLLMLQLTRLARTSFGVVDDQAVVVVGRSLQALAGTATVFVLWLLARRVLPPSLALAAAASLAAAPILVIHAHYLKEDTLLTLWLWTSLLAFASYVERPSARTAILLGLAAGLAFSSHYKSVLLVPLLAAATLFGALGPDAPGRVARFVKQMAISGCVAGVVFLVVNWPLLVDLQTFLAGSGYELGHALGGEDARYRISDFWFSYHLRFSLVPGMSWPAVFAGLGGVAFALWAWRRLGFQDRLILVFAFLFYVVPELSPLKSERYVVPLTPALVYLAWRAVGEARASTSPFLPRLAVAAAAVALLAAPLYRTVRLVSSMAPDTRERAARWLQAHPGNAIVEQYAGLAPTIWMAADVDVVEARDSGIAYIVVSNLSYQRFFSGGALPNQEPEVYRMRDRYAALFRHPFVEFLPAYESYGFNNPTIRIVDIRNGERRQ